MKQPLLVWLYPGRLDQVLHAQRLLVITTELCSLGWQVVLISAGPAGKRVIDGTETTCIPMNNIFFLRQFIFHVRFYWLLIKYDIKPDVIMFEQMSAPWMFPVHFVRFLKRRRRPLLALDIRSLHMDVPKKQGVTGWLRGCFHKLSGRYAKLWVDGYLTITTRMADFMQLQDKQLWGVWPSGVDLELFRPIQKSHIWPKDDMPVRLIYIGTLNHGRNLMNLCLAVEQANAEGLTFELWLVGNGTEGSSLEEFAGKTNGQIRVFASVSHDEIPAILAQAHLGVLPFTDEVKFQVSSPIKLFEYMAAGMPLLATRLNCHTDVVGDGDYIFWAESASALGLLDALKLVWKQRARLAQMGTQAASAAPAWTWRASAMKLKKALEIGLERHPE
jgi:glycosyltransferase involved in cell wall biosynthesis